MTLSTEKLDSEPEKNLGTPMPIDELLRMADITAQDVSKALDRFSEAVPPRYKELLD